MQNPLLQDITNAADRVDSLLDLFTPITDSNGYRRYIANGSTINAISHHIDLIINLCKAVDRYEREIKNIYENIK